MPQSLAHESRRHQPTTSPLGKPNGHWLFPWLCTLMLALALLLALADAATVEARSGPTRRDRRPDREVRIRYPRTQPPSSGQSTNTQSNSTTIQSAPPSVATPSSTDTTISVPPTTGD